MVADRSPHSVDEHDLTMVEVAGPSAPTPPVRPAARPAEAGEAAEILGPLLHAIFGPRLPTRFEFWDGSEVGPAGAAGTVRVRSKAALRRIMWAPGELGLGRTFIAGEIDLDGDIFDQLRILKSAAPKDLRLGASAIRMALTASYRLGVLGVPPAPPVEEARPRGWRHSRQRDADAISHHYDVGNDFYALVLGSSMTYSCARYTADGVSLDEAQAAKHELVCRKLNLDARPGMRLLDVGCGWGSMAMHAAAHHDASVVGITISQAQAELARRRAADAGLAGQVEIRLQDYRELRGETFDAISSVGMFEHVGRTRMAEYFDTLRGLLAPRGRLLNHAISSVGGSRLARRGFLYRYVFPDGELIDVGDVALAMERAGFEVRDVESLREHYAKTLRAWVANLDNGWDEAVALVGAARARIWRLYMAGSALGFEAGDIGVHQVLGLIPDNDGGSGMPPTRREWE